MTQGEMSLLGQCESCLMPFKKDPNGTHREHAKHCSYCYSNGKFFYAGNDVREFKKTMVRAMTARGESKLKATFFAWMAGFAPRWKHRPSAPQP